MGAFINVIIHERQKYFEFFKKEPKYLILGEDKIKLLSHELLNQTIKNELLNISSIYDSASRKQIKTFLDMEIIQPKIMYQGSFGWALGD